MSSGVNFTPLGVSFRNSQNSRPQEVLDELALVDWKLLRKKGKKKPRNYDAFKEYILEDPKEFYDMMEELRKSR